MQTPLTEMETPADAAAVEQGGVPANWARPNVFEIDLGAVAVNTRRLRELVGADTVFFATLKADAYGFGVMQAAPVVLAAGADALALSNLDEAVALRRAGIGAPILVYAGSMLDAEVVHSIQAHQLMPSLHSDAAIETFLRHSRARTPVAVKIEVGPERLGLVAEQALASLRRLARSPQAELRLIHCHPNFPAGERGAASLAWQFERFSALAADLRAEGIEVPLTLVASSKVLHRTGRAMMRNAVDPGAALFDTGPDGRSPIHSLRTRLLQARLVTRDQHLDSALFPIRAGMRVGIVPIGLADGFHRWHAGHVLIRGRRAPLLCAPSLEYSRIDLTEVPDAAEGDEVVIVGRQGGAAITPAEVVAARQLGRIHDIAMDVKPQVRRVYRPAAEHASQGAPTDSAQA